MRRQKRPALKPGTSAPASDGAELRGAPIYTARSSLGRRECRARDARIREQEGKILEYDAAVRDRNATIQGLREEADRLRARLQEVENRLARATAQLAGRSYRIGRAITAPWRLLRGTRS